MQVEDPFEGTHTIPIVWYFAPPGAKTYFGVNAFSAGVWDRDTPALPPQLGEQPPYAFPYYTGENVWGYTGQCVIGTPEQFASGLSRADLAAPAPPPPECCTPVPFQLPLGERIRPRLLSPGTQQVFQTAGLAGWTAPPGVFFAMVEAWGAGHTGRASFGPNTRGEGGGGGAYSRSIVAVTPGVFYPLQVGTGSAATQADAASWFGAPDVFAAGAWPPAINPTAVRTPGLAAACIGQVAFDGGWGHSIPPVIAAGGGGSSAGQAAVGNLPTSTPGGGGEPAPTGGGGGGDGANAIHSGIPGNQPGGGGGGGLRAGVGPAKTPGPGGDGQVVVSW